MKNLKVLMVLWNVLRGLYPTIQAWVEAIDCKGFGEEKKKEIMEAVKMSVEITEKLTGVKLQWEEVIEPLASVFVEMAVHAMKRKLTVS